MISIDDFELICLIWLCLLFVVGFFGFYAGYDIGIIKGQEVFLVKVWRTREGWGPYDSQWRQREQRKEIGIREGQEDLL